ncbi:MAG: polymer-forming cytoskeletal protein [Anaerolineales bacterium]|nr:polymer-forming cytoskeletal protein [Anaerolineales bacterium]
MFKRNTISDKDTSSQIPFVERITSVLGAGLIWHGSINGSGGVRIEGAFEGQIALHGMLVVGETGRVTCENIRANTVIVAGAVRGNITTEKLEIRSTGRVWGDVVTTGFVTEEGSFLRGQIRMEETVELDFETVVEIPALTPIPEITPVPTPKATEETAPLHGKDETMKTPKKTPAQKTAKTSPDETIASKRNNG